MGGRWRDRPAFLNTGNILARVEVVAGGPSEGSSPKPSDGAGGNSGLQPAAEVGDRAHWTWVFEGGPQNSIVGRCIGAAEGTLNARGDYNKAYSGHVDPGNGVWNLGLYSYQHGASSPAEADQKQFERLQGQMAIQENQAYKLGLVMTLEERLQGGDLANQSPISGKGGSGRIKSRGYIPLLVDAKLLGLADKTVEHEGVALPADVDWARTSSYIDPQTNRWTSTGLGATEGNTRRDQRRRMVACNAAIAAFRTEGKVPEGW